MNGIIHSIYTLATTANCNVCRRFFFSNLINASTWVSNGLHMAGICLLDGLTVMDLLHVLGSVLRSTGNVGDV